MDDDTDLDCLDSPECLCPNCQHYTPIERTSMTKLYTDFLAETQLLKDAEKNTIEKWVIDKLLMCPRINDKFLTWLRDDTDFFSAPASKNHHCNFEGGLALHSLSVCHRLEYYCLWNGIDVGAQSIMITALLHDLCKANYYKPVQRNRKNEQTDQWEKYDTYDIEDLFPVFHGSKSVIQMLMLGVELWPFEILAIEHHMGPFHTAGWEGRQCLQDARDAHPLVYALHVADMQSTFHDKL